jgi:hypothetical protein
MDINDKVICIDASIPEHMRLEIAKDFQQWIKQDAIYTIREILDNDGITTSVLLNEVHNKPVFFPKTINRVQEPAFRITRFRKLEEATATHTESIKQTAEA